MLGFNPPAGRHLELGPPDRSKFNSGVRERLCRIYFHVAFSEGDEVRVVGDHPSLGSWDPKKGLLLVTHEDIFPCWISSEPIFVNLHSKVKYKYVVTSNSDEGSPKSSVREEADVREFLASGQEMTIEDDDGLHRQYSAVDNNKAVEALTSLARTPSNIGSGPLMPVEERLQVVKDLEGEVSVSRTDTVFMFHFDLPVKVVRSEGGGWEAAESSFFGHFQPLLKKLKQQNTMRVKCVGWPGIHVTKEKEKNEITKFLEDYDCIPVFPPQSEFDEFTEFTNNFLWPVFHDTLDFAQSPNPPPFNEQGWASYQHINNIYANEVVKHSHDSDMIWINDYQLMMMPTFISRKLARANIGFYLHAPFPSSDNFKTLSIREELLSGMLCADQVGFQFFGSARNFVVSCKRIYGLDPTFRACGFIGLDYNGRTVAIKVAHFGLPYEDTIEIVNSEEVARKTNEVKILFEGKILFVASDRCRSLSGLTQKFRDFRRFLTENPQYRGKVILVQYSTPNSDMDDGTDDSMESLKRDADAIVETCEETGALKVKKTGSGEHCDIYLRYEPHEREDRLALFRAGHVLVDTSVKAGLNLQPFDFITAHHDDSEKHSQVIVSEFSGCSRVLLGSLRINPWSSQEVVEACRRAVELGAAERQERWEANLSYTSDYSPVQWFENFVADLRRARKKEGMRIENIGFGAKIRPIMVNSSFQRLNIEQVMRSLFQSKRRVFFLDNEGTLAPDIRRLHREYGAPKGNVAQLSSHGSPPDEQILQCLRDLTEDSRNTVVILSGRSREQMEEWFSSVPKIGLAAERGFYWRLPCVTGDQWQSAKMADHSWKTHAYELMRQFTKRTQGAYIENKGSALIWYYRDADRHYGSWQAKELSSNLKELLFGFDVEVVEGKGYVEVKLRHINKGVAVAKMLSKVAKTFGEPDFVLCCGDDRSDEDMFEVVNLFSESFEQVKDADTASQRSTTDETNDESEGEAPKSKTLQEDRAPLAPLPMLKKAKSAFTTSHSNSESGGLAGGMSGGMSGGFSHSGMNLLGMGSISGDLDQMSNVGSFDEETVKRFYTCVVGRKPSAAKSFIHDVDEMSELLSALATQNKRTLQKSSFTRQGSGGSGGTSAQNLERNANTWSSTTGGSEGAFMTQGKRTSMPGISGMAFGRSGSAGTPQARKMGMKSFGSALNMQG